MRRQARRISSFLVSLLFLSSVRAGNVTWASPSSGDVFGPGDTIAGEWSAEQALSSPSFSLCSQDSDSDNNAGAGDCGAAVWPTVTHTGGTYSISLAVPNVTTTAAFYLKMKDDQGDIMTSPNFSLSPTGVAAASSLPANPASNSSSVHPSATTNSTNGAASATPSAPASTQSAAVTRNPHTFAAPAAVAVPLALVGATLLASLALYLHHRRTLHTQRALAAQLLSRSASVRSGGTGSPGDIEKAISALSAPGYGQAAGAGAPPRHPLPRQDVRRDAGRAWERPAHGARAERVARPAPSPEFTRKLFFDEREHGYDDDDARTVTDAVLADYLQPSPLPTPAPLHGTSYLDLPRAPPPSHRRPQVPDQAKPLPPSPLPDRADVYDAVSRAVGSPRVVRLL